jgi:hypothetical protein
MPPQDCVRLNDTRQTEQAWPEPSHPYQQRSITPTQPQTVGCTPQGNIALCRRKRFSTSSRRRDLKRFATKSRWTIASIESDDALILPHHANPCGCDFRERQVDSLKALDLERPIREAGSRRSSARSTHAGPYQSGGALLVDAISNASSSQRQPMPSHEGLGSGSARFSASSRLFDLNGAVLREQRINTVAQSLRQLRRFCHLINADKVFGTHSG